MLTCSNEEINDGDFLQVANEEIVESLGGDKRETNRPRRKSTPLGLARASAINQVRANVRDSTSPPPADSSTAADASNSQPAAATSASATGSSRSSRDEEEDDFFLPQRPKALEVMNMAELRRAKLIREIQAIDAVREVQQLKARKLQKELGQ